MKSFKHEHLFYLHSYMSSQHTLSRYCVLPLDSLNYYTFLVYNYELFYKIKTEAYFV